MEPEKHARLGPSNHRWPVCPGSVREEAKHPDISGPAAVDGTGSHLLLELCLKNNVPAESYDRSIIGENHHDNPNGWLVDIDRCKRVQMCLDYIEGRVKALKEQFSDSFHAVTVETESIANPGGIFGRDDWWGTCDVTITVLNIHKKALYIEVIDYKDGQMWVAPEGNTQLISYLGGKARPFIASGPDLVRPLKESVHGGMRMTICQPKTNPPIRSADMDSTKLIAELERLSEAAWRTDQPDAPLVPDDKGGKGHCRWCKHSFDCNAHTQKSLEVMNTMGTEMIASDGGNIFELITAATGDLTTMEESKLTKIYDAMPGIQAAFDKVQAEIQRRAETGEIDGFEMGPGRGSNVWNETEEVIAKKLKAKRLKLDEIYPRKLVTPAQALKLESLTPTQKKKIEEELISFKAGKDALKRVAFGKKKPSVEMMFAEVVKEEPKQKVVEEEVSFF